MTTKLALTLPKSHEKDIERAVSILKDAGCSHVFLFGSIATGKGDESSDIDLAVQGCSKGQFFSLFGKLMLELAHPVDLVRLDGQDPFARFLQSEGELVQLGVLSKPNYDRS